MYVYKTFLFNGSVGELLQLRLVKGQVLKKQQFAAVANLNALSRLLLNEQEKLLSFLFITISCISIPLSLMLKKEQETVQGSQQLQGNEAGRLTRAESRNLHRGDPRKLGQPILFLQHL